MGKLAKPSTSTVREVHIVPADRLHDFLTTYRPTNSRDYLAGRIDDPSDPRYSGIQGAYPTLHARAPARLARLLYSRVGILRTIIDAPAEDIWSQGWTALTDDPRVAEAATKWDTLTRIKAAFRAATKLARRDGRAFILLRAWDATGDPEQPPKNVRRIRAEPISRDMVAKITYDNDPDSETFEEPLYYDIRTTPPQDEGILPSNTLTIATLRPAQTTRVHRDRIIPVIQHPKEGNPWDGDSVLGWLLGDGHGLENVKWSAAESFHQHASPLLQVLVDKEVPVDPDDSKDAAMLSDLDKKVADLQSGAIQKIRLHGAEIRPIAGAGSINSPDAYANLFVTGLAAGARMPQRELTGSAAGALASASYDEKRYFKRISNDQQDFATPLIREWYKRLDAWGLVPGLTTGLREVMWNPHLELDEKERSTILLQTSASLRNLATLRTRAPGGELVGLPMPKEAAELLTFPDSVDPEAPLELAASPFPATEAFPVARRPGDPPQDSKRNRDNPAIVFIFPQEDLANAVHKHLTQAGDLGIRKTWEKIGAGEVAKFINTPFAPVIREFANQWARDRAEVASTRLREEVARVLAEGGGFREVEAALRDAFAPLENAASIARTESMRGFNRGSLAAMDAAGVREWEFAAYAGACPICAPLDGRRFPVSDVFSMPPDATHPQCRCVPVPVVAEADARRGRDLRIEVSPDLRDIEDAMEGAVRRVFREWLQVALETARRALREGA